MGKKVGKEMVSSTYENAGIINRGIDGVSFFSGVSYLILTTYIPHCETDVLVLHGFNIETCIMGRKACVRANLKEQLAEAKR